MILPGWPEILKKSLARFIESTPLLIAEPAVYGRVFVVTALPDPASVTVVEVAFCQPELEPYNKIKELLVAPGVPVGVLKLLVLTPPVPVCM